MNDQPRSSTYNFCNVILNIYFVSKFRNHIKNIKKIVIHLSLILQTIKFSFSIKWGTYEACLLQNIAFVQCLTTLGPREQIKIILLQFGNEVGQRTKMKLEMMCLFYFYSRDQMVET